jgi:hypothetical protein
MSHAHFLFIEDQFALPGNFQPVKRAGVFDADFIGAIEQNIAAEDADIRLRWSWKIGAHWRYVGETHLHIDDLTSGHGDGPFQFLLSGTTPLASSRLFKLDSHIHLYYST